MEAFIYIIIGVLVFCLILKAIDSETKDEKVVRLKRKTPQPAVATSVTRKPEPPKFFNETKEFAVKGTYYRNADEKAAARMSNVGDELFLEIDENNSVDPNAVKVFTLDGFHIGYVDAKMSQYVKDRIDHVRKCCITHLSAHEVPYIDAEITFSAEKCRRKEDIPEDFRLVPDRMMKTGNVKEYDERKYNSVCHAVCGTYDLPKDSISRAKRLRQGEIVVLKKHPDSEYIKNRVDVYSEDEVILGYIKNDLEPNFYDDLDSIVRVHVDTTMSSTDNERFGIRFYTKRNLGFNKEPFSTSIRITYDGSYPQLEQADVLKRTDTSKALELALPIAEIETDIEAKFLCCQCYRLQKDYKAEREMIIRIINHIESATLEWCPPSRYYYFQHQLPVMKKRLATVESRLANQEKKKQ